MGRVRDSHVRVDAAPCCMNVTMAGLDTGFGAIGVFVVTPSFTRTLRPNQTHLGRYTRTVSLPPGVASLP